MNTAKRALASAALAAASVAVTAPTASAAGLGGSASIPTVEALTSPTTLGSLSISPVVTSAVPLGPLEDSKDLASMAHLGSLDNSKDLASMAHLGSLEHSLAGSDLSKVTSLEGSNWTHAGSSEVNGNQVNTTIPVVVPVNFPIVTNMPIALVNKDSGINEVGGIGGTDAGNISSALSSQLP